MFRLSIGVLLWAPAISFSQQSRPAAQSRPVSQPAPSIGIGEAIQLVCQYQGPRCNMMMNDLQLYYRLRIVQVYEGYQFRPEHAARWRGLLDDETAGIYGRMCAARFLLETDDQKARSFLEEQLASPNRRRCYNAAHALIDYVDSSSKTWAIRNIIKLIQDERFMCTVVEGETQCGEFRMNHIPGDLRDFPEGNHEDGLWTPFDRLCQVLRETKSQEAVPALIALLDRYPEEGSIASALGGIGDSRARPALLNALPRSHWAATDCIRALGEIRYKPAAPMLIGLLLHSTSNSDFASPGRYGGLIETLGYLGDKKAIPAIRAKLSYLGDHQDAEARRALAYLEHIDPVPRLLELLSSESDPDDRMEIIWDLDRLQDPRSVKPMAQVARTDPNPWARRWAIDALAAVGTDEALLTLAELLTVNYDLGGENQKGYLPPEFFRAEIRERLKMATGQDFGEDAKAWQTWLHAHQAAGATRKAPVTKETAE